ncbi:MAG: hypothetical protein ABFR63_07445 [Thermodesulfobacteriota bacterium]
MSGKSYPEYLSPHEQGLADDELVELKLQVPARLYRAYQRCSWIITHETGRDQLDIMEEMVQDYLVKNQC